MTQNNRTDTVMTRYDSVYLPCSKKLTGSQLSLPHGINRNQRQDENTSCTNKQETTGSIHNGQIK